jgi:DNA polymerase-3 subunit epsilon
LYSVIDIEATGGNSKNGKITEVAIFHFDGKKIVKQYSTLINPQMKIPWYVQKLTGIKQEMVRSAPVFSEVAEQLYNMLEGTCFVAHNVKADYSFMQAEFELAGINFKSERLCSLELSKKLIPEAPSHGLSKICDFLDINMKAEHRAEADALATVSLLEHLIKIDSADLLQKSIRKANYSAPIRFKKSK